MDSVPMESQVVIHPYSTLETSVPDICKGWQVCKVFKGDVFHFINRINLVIPLGYELTARGAGCRTETVTEDGYHIESDTPKSAGGLEHESRFLP